MPSRFPQIDDTRIYSSDEVRAPRVVKACAKWVPAYQDLTRIQIEERFNRRLAELKWLRRNHLEEYHRQMGQA